MHWDPDPGVRLRQSRKVEISDKKYTCRKVHGPAREEIDKTTGETKMRQQESR
jgi:hypothetical protein